MGGPKSLAILGGRGVVVLKSLAIFGHVRGYPQTGISLEFSVGVWGPDL